MSQTTATFASTHHGDWDGEVPTEVHGLRHGPWALHWAPAVGARRLYDRRSEPDEHVDVAARHPDVADDLQARLERLLADHRARRPATSFGAGAGTNALLEEVGYISDD